MPKKVSKKQVAKVLAEVHRVYGSYITLGTPGPSVSDYYSESGAPVIIWEEGPEDWTVEFAREFPVVGVFIEPVNHVVLGMYPA